MEVYKCAVATIPGFEGIAAEEVEELTGAKASASAAGIVDFQVKSVLDLCRLCYLSQSASSVLFQGVKINQFGIGSREYSVFGKQNDVSGSLAYLLLRASGYSGREFLFDPFSRCGAIAIEAALYSSGFPVNYYRKDSVTSSFSGQQPFSNLNLAELFSAAEKNAAAAAKKRLKGIKPKILSSSSSMQNVRNAEKNAKLAGVNKLIRFSRLDIEWLDAKLGERSIDLVVSYPPQYNSGGGSDFVAAEKEKLRKMYKNFFYQADFFLSRKGRIALLLKRGNYGEAATAAAAYKFKSEVIRSFNLGAKEFELVKFGRNI